MHRDDGRRELLQVALGDGGIGVFERDDFALLGDADAPIVRGVRLRAQAAVASAAAAINAAAVSGFITSIPPFIGKASPTGATRIFLLAPTSSAAK